VLAVLLRPIIGYRLILDAHNEAVEPYLHRTRLVRALTHWLIRQADRVIVSNRQLAEIVQRQRGHPLILPDALPTPPEVTRFHLREARTVAVISTYAGDEPIMEIMEAARLIGPNTHFFVTGNDAKCPESVRQRIPDNVVLTGFLSEVDYWSLLASCDVIVDLSTMDNCLVCGAYEAVALGKPLLLSNNAASVELFSSFAEFTDNTSADIAASIIRLQSESNDFAQTAAMRRDIFETNWRRQADELKKYIMNNTTTEKYSGIA